MLIPISAASTNAISFYNSHVKNSADKITPQANNIEIKNPEQKVDITKMASSIKEANGTQHNDTKSADLTDVEGNASKVAGEFVMDATTKGLAEAILKRTVGIPSVEEADKVIQDTLKNETNTSVVQNIENAWDDWKKNYYKDGNISTGDAFKAGINLIPTMGRGICNGVLETATNLVKDITSEDGAKTVSNAVHTVSEAASTVGNAVVNTVKGIGSALATPFVAIKDAICGTSDTGKTAGSAWDSIKAVGTGLWNGIKSVGTNIWDTAKSAFAYVGKGVCDFFSNPIKTIKDAAVGAWNGIKNFFKSIF